MNPRIFIYLVLAGLVVPAAAGEEPERQITNNGNVVLEGVPPAPEGLSDRLARYQNTRSAGFGDWTADGSGMFVTTRFGSTTQIHHVAMPGGARRQITFFEEPARGPARRPHGSDLTFLMDEGGSEFNQVFLLDSTTGGHRRLTDGSSRNGAVLWSRDGDRIAFQSTRRNGTSNDVWVMEIDDPSTARLVVEAPDGAWWAASDWSPDGKSLLVRQYVSVNESRIYLADLESGALRLLAGGEDAPGNYLGFPPRFDAAGAGIFLSTDREGNFNQLAYMDLATGDLDFITDGIAWNVESFELSDAGDRAAFTVNEGGASRLYLLDPATHAFEAVDVLPPGLISRLGFNPDGSRLAMTLNSSTTPSDVFSLELGEGPTAPELVRWTYSEVGGLDTGSFVEPELISYPTFDDHGGEPRRIPAYVYRPVGAGPHPVIVSIHGGPEGQFRPGFRSDFQMWMAELGVAVIAPNVRGSAGYGKEYVKLDNGFQREDSVRDIGALLDWIAAQPDLDESRTGVYGGSYGGYMVLASLVHYSERLKAAVDIVGISNFVTFLQNTQDYRRDLRRVEYGDERDPAMRAHLEKISPNRHVDKMTVPLFVAQGQNDPRVPVTESEQIVRDVRGAGHDVWYMNALNEGHGFRKKENRDLYREIVVMFFEEHLLGR